MMQVHLGENHQAPLKTKNQTICFIFYSNYHMCIHMSQLHNTSNETYPPAQLLHTTHNQTRQCVRIIFPPSEPKHIHDKRRKAKVSSTQNSFYHPKYQKKHVLQHAYIPSNNVSRLEPFSISSTMLS